METILRACAAALVEYPQGTLADILRGLNLQRLADPGRWGTHGERRARRLAAFSGSADAPVR